MLFTASVCSLQESLCMERGAGGKEKAPKMGLAGSFHMSPLRAFRAWCPCLITLAIISSKWVPRWHPVLQCAPGSRVIPAWGGRDILLFFSLLQVWRILVRSTPGPSIWLQPCCQQWVPVSQCFSCKSDQACSPRWWLPGCCAAPSPPSKLSSPL